VRAADAVIREARTGVGHWSQHVKAQSDANAGIVTVPEMDAIFKRTRLAGPGDVQRYGAAVSAYHAQTATCSTVSGAPATVGDKLTTCSDREKAQGPVLTAAADAMADWKSHLAKMQLSKMGHVANPQGVWIQAWRAAPPHINAFKKAFREFHAPPC
jgi:hypothetical protein